MSEYTATVKWRRQSNESFIDSQYSRGHEWQFDGGVIVPASASPHVVALPYSVEANVDPEEAFVSSLSSCHMLFFLSIAAKNRFVVDDYSDDAIGFMQPGADGKMCMTRVILRPQIIFSGHRKPDRSKLEKMQKQRKYLFYALLVTVLILMVLVYLRFR